MTKIEQWPAPDWAEVIVSWTWIMASPRHDINKLIQWVENSPGGNYHIHGINENFDFAFRFENPADATWFRMNLPQ